MPGAQRKENSKAVTIMKPPPNYEEAIKAPSTTKNRKKSIKSQAVDDVLEILIKNGELPPSAAQEPQTPTTPEKMRNTAFPTPLAHQHHNQLLNAEQPQMISHGGLEVGKDNQDKDINLELDFTLDLQELADSMDFSALTQEHEQNYITNPTARVTSISTDSGYEGQSSVPSSEMSLNDLMDFRDSPVNVDWMSELSSMQSENKHDTGKNHEVPANVMHTFNGSGDTVQNNARNSCQPQSSKVKQASSTCSSSNCSSTFGCKDHDPVLPNNMVGTSQGDAYIEMFFDANDLKGPHELDSLVWDKLDFST